MIMTPHDIQKLLADRSGIPSYVYTVHGEMLYVNDLFWLKDEDEEFAYAITNSNTGGENLPSNSFYSNEIVKVVDYRTLEVIFDSDCT